MKHLTLVVDNSYRQRKMNRQLSEMTKETFAHTQALGFLIPSLFFVMGCMVVLSIFENLDR